MPVSSLSNEKLRPPVAVPATNRLQILVLQSTTFCNIDCSYCYLPGRSRKNLMSEAVLARVADEVIASPLWGEDSLILWHAGEPLSCGTDWYDAAHATLGRNRPRLRIQFQTNGTLIDRRWTSAFQRWGAWVGVSIDGPKVLHDRHRRDRLGKPTFDRVMAGVRLLRQEGVPFTTIAVISRESLACADEIFEFFAELRPERLAFSIEEAEGSNARSSLYREELVAEVETFFERVTTLNLRLARPLRIREVEHVLTALIAPSGRVETSQETALGWIVSVGARGDVAFFSPELLTTLQADGESSAVGNLLTSSLGDLLSAQKTRAQAAAIQAGVARCRESCAYFSHCGGGSPANKYFESQRFDVSETWYCRLAKQATVRGVLRAIAGEQAAE